MSMSQVDRDEQDAITAAKKPMEDWQAQMRGSLSDDLENIIDALDAPSRARIAKETKDKYDIKKILRTQKPN